MVAGHLHEKNGLFYIILNIVDEQGKRKPKWISTGLPIKGNKKKAEALLLEARKAHSNEITVPDDSGILFADYIEKVWLPSKYGIEKITLAGYVREVKVISKYFREQQITLGGISVRHIEDFYDVLRNNLSECSVQKYHAKIHSALKHAARKGIIPSNQAANVDRPQREQFIASFYNTEEMETVLDAVKGTNLELAVMLGFYGLRRSEVVGLRWDCVKIRLRNLRFLVYRNQLKIIYPMDIVDKMKVANSIRMATFLCVWTIW